MTKRTATVFAAPPRATPSKKRNRRQRAIHQRRSEDKHSAGAGDSGADKPKTAADKQLDQAMAKTPPAKATKQDVEKAVRGLASQNRDTREHPKDSLEKIKQAADAQGAKAQKALQKPANREKPPNSGNPGVQQQADKPKTPEDKQVDRRLQKQTPARLPRKMSRE